MMRDKPWGVRMTVTAALCLALTGCGTSEYLITKHDGTVITTYGEPKVDQQSGMVSYRDEQGRQMQLQREEVSQIIER